MKSALPTVVVVALDQLSKLVVARAIPYGDRVPLVGSAIRLVHTRNTGAVFGIGRGAGAYFTVFSVVAACLIVIALSAARRMQARVRLGLSMILGGALGNLIDRLRLGAVTDFIDIGVGDGLRWPSFNLADVSITAGVALLALTMVRPSGLKARGGLDSVGGKGTGGEGAGGKGTGGVEGEEGIDGVRGTDGTRGADRAGGATPSAARNEADRP